jgi:sugar-specific transcriptional regulator TrmB
MNSESKNKLLSYLKTLGLSEIEAELYLNMISIGPLSVRELAQNSGIKRTTAYLYIDQLVEKGLAMKIVKNTKKKVAATPPDQIQALIHEKLSTIESIKKETPDVLKKLSAIHPRPNPQDAEIKYFKGLNAARRIYEEAFSGEEMRSYVKVEEQDNLSPDNMIYFEKALKKNKKLKMWEIVYESPLSRRPPMVIASQREKYFFKLMPKELKWSITSEDIVMYQNKVAIISYTDNISAIVLHSPDFYNNSKEIFDFIWRILPEPEK